MSSYVLSDITSGGSEPTRIFELHHAPPVQEPQPSNAEEMKRIVEAGIEVATYIPLRQALAPYLIEPFLRTLKWPYSKPEMEIPCWIFSDLSFYRPRLTLGYSVFGHGRHGDPWGIVLSDTNSMGRDDSWFACLEDAFIQSGACRCPLPDGYEIR